MALEERQNTDYLGRPRARLVAAPSATARRRWRSIAVHAGVLLLYTLLALLISWPMATAFTSGIIGAEEGVDAFQGTWNLWWVATALSNAQLPFFTPLLYYPSGVDLFWQTSQFTHGVAALPITLLLGPLAGFNWTVLLSFVLGGYFTFLLARAVSGHSAGALVAGVVFAFSSYHVQRMVDGPVEVTAFHWVPLYLYALYGLLERPNWWRSLLCGVLLLWVSLGGWYYGLFCVITTGLAAAVWLLVPGDAASRWRWPDRRAWTAALWAVTPALWWGLVLAPRLLGVVGAPDQLWDLREIQAMRSADLLDFFLPNPLHPLWGEAVRAAREARYPGAVIWNVALGWVGLGLGLIGAASAWPAVRRWVALLGLTLLLAMGPSLRVAGFETGLPLPFALIQDLPGIRSGQRPSHMMVVSSVMLAILAAYGVARLSRRLSPRGGASLAAGLVALIIAVDAYAGPMHIERREVHPFYATVAPSPFDAADRPRGALMPLPLYVNINRSENLTPQMVHRWPILGGYLARPPAYSFSRYAPGIRELEGHPAQPDDIISPAWPELGRQSLAAYGVRYITLDLTSDKADYFALVRDSAARLTLDPPIVADQRLEVYQVPEHWPVAPLGYLGPGWQALEQQAPYRWRWMGESAEIRFFNPLEHPVIATLNLHAASYAEPRPLELHLGTAPAGQLLIDATAPATQQLRLVLPPGEHTLTLSAPASPDPARSGAPISIRLFHLELDFRPLCSHAAPCPDE